MGRALPAHPAVAAATATGPRLQPLHDLFERRQPGGHEVAVGEEHPVAGLYALQNEGLGDGRLGGRGRKEERGREFHGVLQCMRGRWARPPGCWRGAPGCWRGPPGCWRGAPGLTALPGKLPVSTRPRRSSQQPLHSLPEPPFDPPPARLALPQRGAEELPSHAPLRCQPPQGLGGVRPRRQHKHQWAPRAALREGPRKAERQRLHEAAAEGAGHKRRRRGQHAVRPQAADKQQALQLAAARLPLAGQLRALWLRCAEPGLPRRGGGVEGRRKALEGRQGRVERGDALPGLLADPAGRGVGRLLRGVQGLLWQGEEGTERGTSMMRAGGEEDLADGAAAGRGLRARNRVSKRLRQSLNRASALQNPPPRCSPYTYLAAAQEEGPLVFVDLPSQRQHAHSHVQRQQELVALKEATCRMFVHGVAGGLCLGGWPDMGGQVGLRRRARAQSKGKGCRRRAGRVGVTRPNTRARTPRSC
jgi:hypothetical protein